MRLKLVAALMLLSLSLVVAPTPQQNHPLSEIYPIDTDLDMNNSNILDIEQLALSNGLFMQGNNIMASSGTTALSLSDSGNVKVPNGPLKIEEGENSLVLNGTSQNHTYIEFYKNQLNPETRSAWIGFGSSSSSALTIENEEGNRIDLKADKVRIPWGDLDMNSNNIQGISKIQNYFESPCGKHRAVKNIYPNGTLECGMAGGGLPTVLSIDNSAGSYNIDMNSNYIVGLATPNSPQDAATKGYVDSSDDTVADNQLLFRYVDVSGTSLVADSVTDTLSVSAGSGISVSGTASSDSLTISNTGDTSKDSIADDGTIQEGEISQNSLDNSEIEDNSLSEASLASNSVKDSELPNNVIDNSEIQNSDSFTFSSITSNGAVSLGATGSTDEGGEISWAGAGSYGSFTTDVYQNTWRIFDSDGGWLFRVKQNGPVEINSRLTMNSNRITGLADPSNAQDAATKGYVDSSDDTVADDQSLSEVLSLGNSAGSHNLDMNGNNIVSSGGEICVGRYC